MHNASELYPFLLENSSLSPAAFVLKYKALLGDRVGFAAAQLLGLQKASKKLPTWFAHPEIIYPPQLNLEQASSELTAAYKASLMPIAEKSADLTGGFGVDSYYFSKRSKQHYYFELNEGLCQIVNDNFKTLGAHNIITQTADGMQHLADDSHYDFIYIDPSRRAVGRRKYFLEDYEPNVLEWQDKLRQSAPLVMIKVSPMADIARLLQQINGVSEIHIVAVKNECKELLLLLKPKATEHISLKAVNIINETEKWVFDCRLGDEKQAVAQYGEVHSFIYEPNAAILKAGCFNLVAKRYGLLKLHPNTHLYTANEVVDDFPGRIFEVTATKPASANVLIRNHKTTATALLKKMKITEGAVDDYVLAFTDVAKPKVFFAKSLK
ncbi:class I SAM-dependent methyltransferase [bacterium]|nr:class I SAM-dependent methyltransferase [bacterium]